MTSKIVNEKEIPLSKEVLSCITESMGGEEVLLTLTALISGPSVHGNGFLNFKNGNSYDGQLHYGVMSGNGKFTWKDGIEYIGTFQHNKIEGEGRYNWPDGSNYQGKVKNG
jgi:hypothetical protein